MIGAEKDILLDIDIHGEQTQNVYSGMVYFNVFNIA